MILKFIWGNKQLQLEMQTYTFVLLCPHPPGPAPLPMRLGKANIPKPRRNTDACVDGLSERFEGKEMSCPADAHVSRQEIAWS